MGRTLVKSRRGTGPDEVKIPLLAGVRYLEGGRGFEREKQRDVSSEDPGSPAFNKWGWC